MARKQKGVWWFNVISAWGTKAVFSPTKKTASQKRKKARGWVGTRGVGGIYFSPFV
jgi:hypothetical protein